ncbi:MAG: hypothetical protein ACTSVG_03805 [Alphaproteobacteria bacterium]
MMMRCLKVFLAAAAIALAGPAAAQDRPEGCLIEIWPDFFSPGPQQHQLREKLVTDAGDIYAIEFGPLAGEYAKLYLFFLDHGGCERKALIVGSFNYRTEMARQNGEIGSEARRYHIDLFDPEQHTTLEFRTQAPRYEEMREMALNLLR